MPLSSRGDSTEHISDRAGSGVQDGGVHGEVRDGGEQVGVQRGAVQGGYG